MKITKGQLRRIIRNEKSRLLREQPEILGYLPGPPDSRITDAILSLEYVEEALTIMDDEHLRAKVENVIKTLRDIS